MTAVLAEGAEADRVFRQKSAAELVRWLLKQEAGNAVILNTWTIIWAPRVLLAMDALAPLFESIEQPVQTFDTVRATVCADWRTLLEENGLVIPGGLIP